MKPNPEPDPLKSSNSKDSSPRPGGDDPLWDLLGKASKQEPGSFFARNVIRQTRLMGAPSTGLGSRLSAALTPARFTVGAAALACVMAVLHFWPSPDPANTPELATRQSAPEPSTALTELVILESLNAAAEDPSMFTRDEVVAMIGF